MMKRISRIYYLWVNFVMFFLLFNVLSIAQKVDYNSPGRGNPIIPGYFADPTIKKFGDTYYLYSTTDGIKLASGEPQVWISKDFVNWFNYEMDIDIPLGLTNVWAPDVFKGKDGKYYYFMGNCQAGCNIYGYVAETPMGPWRHLNNGNPVIEAGTGIDNLPALDAQYLIDDDHSVYSYFGTWCSSFGGLGWAKIDPENNYSILERGSIPMSQLPEVFEAAYAFKHNGKYILMYSSGDCRLSSYAVHYSVGDSPKGPFVYGANSPILKTSKDGTVDSPGHHSVLKEGGKFYILYHRHDNPHSSGGMFRQVCADSLLFSDDYTILPIKASHEGIGYLAKNQIPHPNLAFNVKASSSSYYHLICDGTKFSNGDIDYKYLPEYAIDDNNGTMWKAGKNALPQSLVIDLAQIRNVKRVMTQFEYSTFYYQYIIECSYDSVKWEIFSDKSDNRRSGSPLIDDNNMLARYIRITVTATEKSGLFAAIWNVKVYDTLFDVPQYQNKENPEEPAKQVSGSCLVDFDARELNYGTITAPLTNKGSLGGDFLYSGNVNIESVDGVKAVSFNGDGFLKLNRKAPSSLSWNASFTASAWVYNPEVGLGECVMVWNSRDNMLQGSYAALMYGTGSYGAVAHGDGSLDLAYDEVPASGSWHHIVISFDGMKEMLFVDGTLIKQLPLSLFVENGDILIGATGFYEENFSGYIANAQLFDKALSYQEVIKLMNDTKPNKDAEINK